MGGKVLSFLRDNWLWLVLPTMIALLALVVFIVITAGDSPIPTRYQIR